MRKLNLLLVSMLFAAVQVFGQAVTNKAALNEISQQKSVEFQVKKADARAFASQNDLPFIIDNDEVLMELMFIDDLGQPQYYITNNANASVSISTNKVNTGGGFGYSLDGNGMTVHEWDGGAVLGTHQEYNGRVVMGDGVTTTHYHSTHVAGTMIASGVQANAKGMAPAANLRAFDWNSDESEMAAEAANGALVSNHSYGYGRGWVWTGTTWSWYGNTSISTQEDYLFGFYDSQAQDWDQIAANAPYYLICKSAGNDRGDGPSNPPYPLDGPYDCVSHAGVAKNVLTVAAVEDVIGGYSGPSSVTMSSFSAWGPCDDGRIKPDISANGVSLYSTDDDNNADYTTLSGTSMATPSAAGSAILLQEHYENLNGTGNYMLASTLKALIIHAADEAGNNPGPDYEFGWGLMNTYAAAEVISDDPSLNTIEEITLNNGGSYQRTVTADGTQPLQVTIVWTDVPGTPVGASLDPSDPMIVNELDLRITAGSNTYYPWKLNRTNPSAAATRNSENNVDNVEMVTIDNPVAGTDYTIVVDHDGTLSGGSQLFSLVVTGIGSATPMPPVADFSANNTNPLTGASVTFTDLSTNAPTTWNWSFSPATVTFVNGTSASSQFPEVTFDVAGTYDVTLEVSNTHGSDTEVKTAYISATDPLPFALPWTEDFEGATTLTYTSNSASLNGLPDWGYEKTANGRLRFSAGSGFYYSGTHAATLDADPSGTYSVNYLTVTLNLSSYAASENLELSFQFMHHGEETHANDRVWIRGSNTDSWIEAYDLDANKGTSGVWNLAQMIDIDALLGGAGQTASQTFQIRFGQEDNYPATSLTASDGYTFDDISIQETDPNAYVISTFPYSQSWEDGFGLWVQGTGDDFDWSRNSGGTPSSSTGPLSAHDGTWYMYTEASSPRVNGDEAHLEAAFNFSTLQSPELTFYYHMFGISIASLHVDVYNGSWNNSVWSAIGPQQSAQGDPYEQAVVDLSAYGGQENITIRFRGIVGSGTSSTYYSDIAIDLVEVTGSTGPVPPVAEFTADVTDIPVGGTVQFTDQSTGNPTSWTWTFEGGDPGTSTDQNPNVTYNTAGIYTVTLEATNAAGSDIETKTAYITVHAPPVADFSGTPTSIDEGGTVNFTDLSTNASSWSWTFEGGTPATSTDQNPAVVYNTAGTYTVTLEAGSPYGTDTETKVGYIVVTYVPTPPVANFTADATDIPVGASVNFTDLTTGDPISWSWTFDGGTPTNSTAQNPSIVYNTAGTYTVTLEATNVSGSDTETKTAYITVHAPPVADFTGTPLLINEGGTVVFTDLSTGGATSWNWTFTGGTPSNSTAQNPSVVYNTAGTYDVLLEVTGLYGSDTETKAGYITVNHVPTPPVADFTASATNILAGENVSFTDISTNSPTSWSWTFVGGTPATSTSQHPVVNYAIAGVYTVELTASNADGSDTETKIDYITVTNPPSSTLLSFTDFEGGWGIWTDGGGDCELYTSGTYAYNGSNAADIQDNSG
ncbi:MAG: PKD domain-containing protein, partial [Bacteroidales bacterium]|nr:PKD domain-containing protein [Bacteroidales bacterium]